MKLAKLRALLGDLADALKLNHKLLARAQRRYAANRKRAFKANQQKTAAQEAADKFRAEAAPALTYGPNLDQAKGEALLRKAVRRDKKAGRLKTAAERNHNRAEFWLGRTKVLQQRIHNLRAHKAETEEELKRLNHVTIEGNHVSGGSARERLRAAIHAASHNCSTGDQRNYYSMSGALPDLGHTLKGMPYGRRFDCSSFATGIHYVCGIADPNGGSYAAGETMYTGSLIAHCETIAKAEAKTGDFVIYLSYPGDTTGHHVEVVDDPSRETTIGHGSAPIDPGVFDLFGNGLYVIKRNPALKGE